MNLAMFLTILTQTGVGDVDKFNDYLTLGYFAMWFIGLLYVISLVTRQRNLKQDIQLMQQLLQEDEESR